MRMLIALVLGLSLSPASRAGSTGGFHLELYGGTTVPTDVGGGLTLHMPFGLRVSGGLGGLPGSYVDLINDLVIALDGYDETTAAIVKDTLKSSLVGNVMLGWKPLPKIGLFIEGGYRVAALGGSSSAQTILEEVTGVSLPPITEVTDRTYKITSTLHMLEFHLGYDVIIAKHFLIRPYIGGAFTVDAAAEITPEFETMRGEAVDELTRAGEDYLITTYKRYVHTPVVGLAIGWRFF